MAEPTAPKVLPVPDNAADILSADAPKFVATLVGRYGELRDKMLATRRSQNRKMQL